MTATRRLAAILAADVAGYSRLMGADEEGTHERLRAHLRQVVEPKISEHNGRIVKNTGDVGGIPERSRCGPLCCRIAASDDPSRSRDAQRPPDRLPDRDQSR
jgi:class 3 adenylate cyclase